MIFASPSLNRTPRDRLAAQIAVARDLALQGSAGPARGVCGSIFLEHLPMLARDAALLGAYVECLLLLEMTALLPRVMQAIHGIGFEMAPTSDRRWKLSFGTGVTLTMPIPSRGGRVRGEWIRSAACWSEIILAEAAREPTGAPLMAGVPMMEGAF